MLNVIKKFQRIASEKGKNPNSIEQFRLFIEASEDKKTDLTSVYTTQIYDLIDKVIAREPLLEKESLADLEYIKGYVSAIIKQLKVEGSKFAGNSPDLKSLLDYNMRAEKIAIEDYKTMLVLVNEEGFQVYHADKYEISEIIEEILADEEDHLGKLIELEKTARIRS